MTKKQKDKLRRAKYQVIEGDEDDLALTQDGKGHHKFESEYIDPRESESKKKARSRKIRNAMGRLRNALINGTAGAALGSYVHGGASGYQGARVGAVGGALIGALQSPRKRSSTADTIAAGGDFKFSSKEKSSGDKKDDRPSSGRVAAEALAGAGIISQSVRPALGLKKVYHGTSGKNWEKIKKEGLKASRGGKEGGSGHAVSSGRYMNNSSGKVHFTGFRPVAEDFASLQRSKNGSGKVVSATISHRDFLRSEPDPDMVGDLKDAFMRRIASRTKKSIKASQIHGSDASIKSKIGQRIRDIRRGIGASPIRTAVGVAGLVKGSLLIRKAIKDSKKRREGRKEFSSDFNGFRKEHQNPNGGLNAKGRAAYNRATGSNLKPPQPKGGKRRDSFCARMKGMKAKLTSEKTANDPNSRINKSLRAWACEMKGKVNELATLGEAINAASKYGRVVAGGAYAVNAIRPKWREIDENSVRKTGVAEGASGAAADLLAAKAAAMASRKTYSGKSLRAIMSIGVKTKSKMRRRVLAKAVARDLIPAALIAAGVNKARGAAKSKIEKIADDRAMKNGSVYTKKEFGILAGLAGQMAVSPIVDKSRKKIYQGIRSRIKSKKWGPKIARAASYAPDAIIGGTASMAADSAWEKLKKKKDMKTEFSSAADAQTSRKERRRSALQNLRDAAVIGGAGYLTYKGGKAIHRVAKSGLRAVNSNSSLTGKAKGALDSVKRASENVAKTTEMYGDVGRGYVRAKEAIRGGRGDLRVSELLSPRKVVSKIRRGFASGKAEARAAAKEAVRREKLGISRKRADIVAKRRAASGKVKLSASLQRLVELAHYPAYHPRFNEDYITEKKDNVITDEQREEIKRDRKTLGKIGAGALTVGGLGYYAIRKPKDLIKNAKLVVKPKNTTKKAAKPKKRKLSAILRTIQFGGRQDKGQLRDADSLRFPNPFDAITGQARAGYIRKDKAGNVVRGIFDKSGKLVRTLSPSDREYKSGKTVVDTLSHSELIGHGQVIKGVYHKANRIAGTLSKAANLGKDVVNVVRGKPRERDSWGRKKKREWEKSWFKKAATGAVLTAGSLAAIKNQKVANAIGRGKKAVKDYVNKHAPDIFAMASKLEQRLNEFDETAPSWDIRDERGRSARVYAPGARPRIRREKKWHEKLENERKLWAAGLVASGLGGAALAKRFIKSAKPVAAKPRTRKTRRTGIVHQAQKAAGVKPTPKNFPEDLNR